MVSESDEGLQRVATHPLPVRIGWWFGRSRYVALRLRIEALETTRTAEVRNPLASSLVPAAALG